MDPVCKIVYSQVGYDVGRDKRAFIAHAAPDARFSLRNAITGEEAFAGSVAPWGEKWGANWNVLDFSGLEQPGDYQLRVESGETLLAGSASPVRVGRDQLWHQSWYAVSLEQLDVRAANAYRPEGGWRDCGSELQEVSSHAIMLEALCDLLESGRLAEAERARVEAHLATGADYIALCQRPEGGFVHEIRHNPAISTGNCANAAAVLARVARLLAKSRPDKAAGYAARAERGYRWIAQHGPLRADFASECFAITHGAPATMQTPPREWMTRDLLAMLGAALALHRLGRPGYLEQAAAYADWVLTRQIAQSEAEYGLYGHFRTYDSFPFSEKANLHCGAWDLPYKNYNQGAHRPHWLLPLIELCECYPEKARCAAWLDGVRRFAYGYFLPACQSSPFGILPAGVYAGGGLLHFSGWYHGHAKIYGYAAALAEAFYRLWGDAAFRALSTANLQWIAGLNVAGQSLIVGVGNDAVRDWNALRGTIVNGFDASRQFSIAPVSRESDLPAFLDDEGGIHHCAGYLTGLCAAYKR